MASQRTITITASAPSGATLPKWVLVTLLDASGGVTTVSERQVTLDAAAGGYVLTEMLDDGSYVLRIDAAAGGVSAEGTPIVALPTGVDAATVSVSFAAAQASSDSETSEGPWLTPALAAAVAAAAGFWVVVLALPSKADHGIPTGNKVAFLVVTAVLAVAGIALFLTKSRTWGVVLMIAGGLVAAAGFALGSKIDLDDGRRMGIGVGGLAVAALIAGIQRFDTIRATVALPIVVVFIGIATWPRSGELIGDDVRVEVIRWVGVLLGATAVAEGATQAASVIAEAKVRAAAVAARSGALASAGQRLVPEPKGDVTRRD